jgi:uncharacterized membrane protein YqjE
VTVTEPDQTTESERATDQARADGADEKTMGELVFEVTEKTTILIREEIELAKAEVSEKLSKLLRGSVVGLVAGVFAFLALILAMHGFAWLLNDLFFDNNFWAGFLIESGLFLLLAIGGGLYAYRALRSGSPPTPDMAIEEAREIRSALEGEQDER